MFQLASADSMGHLEGGMSGENHCRGWVGMPLRAPTAGWAHHRSVGVEWLELGGC